MRAIKGIYKKRGTVKLRESIDAPDGLEVLVVFPTEKVRSSNIYSRLKAELEENYPNLKNRTKQQKKEDFEKISEKIAKELPFESWQEMDRALKMRKTRYHTEQILQ